MKKIANTILLTMAMGILVSNAEEAECTTISQSVAVEVTVDKSQVLEIVSSHMAAAPACACEIVKSAIKASEADAPTVAAIVGAAISEAPDQLRLISQCAIATAPDAMAAIQALLATLDPNSGESGGSKDAKAAAMTDEVAGEQWNPLDFPGDSTSPISGGPGGNGNPGGKVPPGFDGNPGLYGNSGIPSPFPGNPPNPPVVTDPNP